MEQTPVEYFQGLTGYDLSHLLVVLDKFFGTYSQQLTSYCNGQLKQTPITALKLLERLRLEVRNVMELYQLRKSDFRTLADWEVMEAMDEFRTRLETYANLPKYLRSARVGRGYSTTPSSQGVMSPDNTMENFLRREGNTNNSEDDWFRVALDQDISEEDYGPDMDPLTLRIPGTAAAGQQLESVMGYAVGEEALGRDLLAKLTFQDEDLVVLEPNDTLFQSFNILLNLEQGAIPEFPVLGRTPIIGLSKGTVAFRLPSIVRQINQVFDTDDTFVSANVENIDLAEGDAVSLRIGATAVTSFIPPTTLNF